MSSPCAPLCGPQVVRALAVFLTLGLFCGCTTFETASPLRASRVTEQLVLGDDAWPARGEITAAELATVATSKQWLAAATQRRQVDRVGEELVARDVRVLSDSARAELAGMGLILDLSPEPDPEAVRQALAAERPLPTVPKRALIFHSQPAGTPAGTLQTLSRSGRYMTVREGPAETPPAGIILQLHGLGGTEYEEPVADALWAAGFTIVGSDFPWERWQPIAGTLSTLEDVHAMAARLGSMSDDALAEAAFAAEAAVIHLWRSNPELAGKPVIILGFSAGSLAGPTVAARLGERCTAMVLVASGVNLVGIAQESELTNGGVRAMRFGRRVSGAMAGLLSGVYLNYTKLDPYHTALACRRLPTLLMLGRADSIVPTSFGTELSQRLNLPDVLSYAGGHRAVFFALSSARFRLAEWIDEAARSSPTMRDAGVQSAKPRQDATRPAAAGQRRRADILDESR